MNRYRSKYILHNEKISGLYVNFPVLLFTDIRKSSQLIKKQVFIICKCNNQIIFCTPLRFIIQSNGVIVEK